MDKHLSYVICLLVSISIFVQPSFAQNRAIITSSNLNQLQEITILSDSRESAISDVVWSADSQWLAVGRSEGPVVYAVPAFSSIPEINDVRADAIAFSPIESLVAVATVSSIYNQYESGIYLTNINTGETVYLQHEFASSLAFDASGVLLASGSADGKIYIWNVETQMRVAELSTQSNTSPTSLTFSPDGSVLVVVTTSEIQVLDVSSSQRDSMSMSTFSLVSSETIPLPITVNNTPTNVVFDPSGETIFFSTNTQDSTTISQQWSIVRSETSQRSVDLTVQPVSSMMPPSEISNNITQLAIHPSGELLALTSIDGSFHIMDVNTGVLRLSKSIEIDSPLSSLGLVHIAFSPDGTMLAVASVSDTVHVFGIS